MTRWIHVPDPATSAPDRAEVGGKAASLASLARVRDAAGRAPEVPPWVALRTAAFSEFAWPAVAALEPGRRAEALRALVPPDEMRDSLRAGLRAAGIDGARVAVRSSAVAEDGAEASFAGQFESVLGVPAGPDDAPLWDAIRRVWASSLGARALAYGGGGEGAPAAMAVLIQAMVEPIAAGVAFDADPVSGDRETIVVSAVWGLGESLVSGDADADTFRLACRDGAWRVRERAIAHKTHELVGHPGGTDRRELSPDRADAPALDDAQAGAVASWTRAASAALGAPQDLEWALAGSPPRVFLLQARPITTLPAAAAGAPAGLEAARRIWDNSNIVESYSGVTTPLTFTFARSVYEDVYRQFCRLMGVPEARIAAHAPFFANMLGLVRGRVYYQLLNWYRTLALLPGFSFNRAFMERMMGVRERLEDPPPPPGSGSRLMDLFHLAGMVLRMGSAASALHRDVPAFHARVDRVLAPLAGADLDARPPEDLVALYRELERELLAHWRAPLVNDFFAMMAFGALGRAIERWLPEAPPTLVNDLLCGEGGIVSTEPARAVMDLARTLNAAPELRAAFDSGEPDAALWRRIHDPERHPALAAALDAYVARFGDRCMDELKLETVTLRDDPGFLLGMLRAYLVQGTLDPVNALERERAIRATAERTVEERLRGPKRAAFRWVLAKARVRVRDRENLRFERTRVFGIVRRLSLAIGGAFAATGRLAERRDVLWLTLDEMLGSASTPAGDFRPRVAERKARFAAWAALPPPPDRFETQGAVVDWLAYDPPELARVTIAGATGGPTLQGLGCCPGVVRARVRVVSDPTHARDLAGRILVAERTDPGWTLLFPAVSGLLVQRGSLLSHSAIVAREMGIPCVVGIPGLLDTVRDGEELEMDGTTGRIVRLEAETA